MGRFNKWLFYTYLNKKMFEIGDKVVIVIPKEDSVRQRYNGILATVVGFMKVFCGRLNSFDVKPGVYFNKSFVKIRLDSGEELTEHISFLRFYRGIEYFRRCKKLLNPIKSVSSSSPLEFIEDLPKTPFLEGDIVRVISPLTKHLNLSHEALPDRLIVKSVNYEKLNEKTPDGAKFPAYLLYIYSGNYLRYSCLLANEDEIEFVGRTAFILN